MKFFKESEFIVNVRKKRYTPRNSWISSSSIETKKGRQIKKKYLRTKNVAHLENLKNLHKQYKSQLKSDKMNFIYKIEKCG